MELENRADKLFEKSIQVLKLLCFDNGAIISAPTSHSYCDHIWKALGTSPLTPESLGYHRVWVRDGTYIAMALDATGNHDQARMFYEWCMQVQDHSGCWIQCYWPDGRKAVDNLEIDEVGTPIFGVYNHYLMTSDEGWLSKTWPMTHRAATFLIQNLRNNGLVMPSYDLWEQRWGHHLYSNAAAAAALLSASFHAERCGKKAQAEEWRNASEALKKTLLEKFWFAEKAYFVRSIDPVAIGADISTLGLVFPFSLLPPEDANMVSTVREIEAKLVKRKGVARYLEHDNNRAYKHDSRQETTENLWVPAALWLALYYLKAKQRKKAQKLYNLVVENASDDLLLPQQIDKRGKAFVVPYGVSHALFILVILEFGNHLSYY